MNFPCIFLHKVLNMNFQLVVLNFKFSDCLTVFGGKVHPTILFVEGELTTFVFDLFLG